MTEKEISERAIWFAANWQKVWGELSALAFAGWLEKGCPGYPSAK